MLAFIEERDRALLAAGIGAGDYQFLYTVAYSGCSERTPATGRASSCPVDDDGERGGRDWTVRSNRRFDSGDEAKRETARRDRADALRAQLNRIQRQTLRQQLAALDAAGTSRRAAAAAGGSRWPRKSRRWTTSAAAWPGNRGLPDAARASLEPFRDRFEASYDAMTGALEMHLEGRD